MDTGYRVRRKRLIKPSVVNGSISANLLVARTCEANLESHLFESSYAMS